MSYILEALKKADQERTLGDVPDLEATHWGERRRKRSYRWVWIVAVLLLVNSVLLYLLFGRDAVVVPGADGLSGPADPVPVTPVPRVEKVEEMPSREIARPREPVYVPPSVPVKQPTARVQKMPPLQPEAAFKPPPAYAPPSAPAAVSDVPEWNDLSLEFRSGLSLPRIDVHVYSDDPGRRFVLIDLQKFREGETLANGAVLEEILPDSIQLYYQGTRFRVEK